MYGRTYFTPVPDPTRTLKNSERSVVRVSCTLRNDRRGKAGGRRCGAGSGAGPESFSQHHMVNQHSILYLSRGPTIFDDRIL